MKILKSTSVLNSGVLVLNRLFQAIHVTSVRRAFCLIYKDEAKAVEPDYSTHDWQRWTDFPVRSGDLAISTPGMQIRVPRVVLLTHLDRLPPHEVRFTRKNIYLRDRNRCQYCGRHFLRRDLNLDHVVPLSRGGRSTWENVVCCCLKCNARKGDRLPAEAGLRLLKKPMKAGWHPIIRFSYSGPAYEAWRNFLEPAF
jgi:5-methylcytosine-specific restriction endonuclease McrA